MEGSVQEEKKYKILTGLMDFFTRKNVRDHFFSPLTEDTLMPRFKIMRQMED